MKAATHRQSSRWRRGDIFARKFFAWRRVRSSSHALYGVSRQTYGIIVAYMNGKQYHGVTGICRASAWQPLWRISAPRRTLAARKSRRELPRAAILQLW